MTTLQIFGLLALRLLFNSGRDKLTLKTVQEWIHTHSNLDECGRGYAGSQLRRGPSSAFIEIVKHPKSNGKSSVTATVYANPRQGSYLSKTWDGKKLDSDLEKFFGKNLRVRIDV